MAAGEGVCLPSPAGYHLQKKMTWLQLCFQHRCRNEPSSQPSYLARWPRVPRINVFPCLKGSCLFIMMWYMTSVSPLSPGLSLGQSHRGKCSRKRCQWAHQCRGWVWVCNNEAAHLVCETSHIVTAGNLRSSGAKARQSNLSTLSNQLGIFQSSGYKVHIEQRKGARELRTRD